MDPRDLNLNHAEYADELNGYLDRDNFPASFITSEMLEDDACNEFFFDKKTLTEYPAILDSDSVSWQRTDTSDSTISSVTVDLKADALLMCEWSGTWQWAYDHDSFANTIPDSDGSYRDPTDTLIRVRMLVDGITVAESGFSPARREYDSVFLVGAAPASAGLHDIVVEFQIVVAYDTESGTPFYYVSDDYTVTVGNRELIVRARYR